MPVSFHFLGYMPIYFPTCIQCTYSNCILLVIYQSRLPCRIEMQILYPVEDIHIKALYQFDSILMDICQFSLVLVSNAHITIVSCRSYTIKIPLFNPNAFLYPVEFIHLNPYASGTPLSWIYAYLISHLYPVHICQVYLLGHISIKIPLSNRNANTLSC
jgi:hypothetical protein